METSLFDYWQALSGMHKAAATALVAAACFFVFRKIFSAKPEEIRGIETLGYTFDFLDPSAYVRYRNFAQMVTDEGLSSFYLTRTNQPFVLVRVMGSERNLTRVILPTDSKGPFCGTWLVYMYFTDELLAGLAKLASSHSTLAKTSVYRLLRRIAIDKLVRPAADQSVFHTSSREEVVAMLFAD